MNPTTFTASNCDPSIPMSSEQSQIADNKDSDLEDMT